MITINDYYGPYWLSPERTAQTDLEAESLLAKISLLVLRFPDGVSLQRNLATGTYISGSGNGGFRPAGANAKLPNAAPRSKHMAGQAVDLYDPEGILDEWLNSEGGRDARRDLGLWQEHPSSTKGWCHLQSIPPRSGAVTFYP